MPAGLAVALGFALITGGPGGKILEKAFGSTSSLSPIPAS